ncbi:MAG: hypothetical protein QOJ35_3203 [Solirubrobacteraceae bacterium]|jgi:hypothetical protein|nr:hypothetical protein [Solirubrobacteraceae bacterium]
MKTTRTIAVSLVIACTAIAPAAALASHGADDDPAVADDHGGATVAQPAVDDNPGADDVAQPAAGAGDDAGAGVQSHSSATRQQGKRVKQVVRVTGTCTAGSTARLKVKRDRGRLKASFEVDQNVVGVTWDVTIRRNDAVAVSRTATTRAPSGSFDVERRLRNGAGPDAIAARAQSPSGEVCTAELTI